ncbi:MAG: alpha/beta fold hydrolase [Acidimicrobiia bacterium]
MFVHGFWQAAWTWDEYVMPALADREQHCIALSLRGHGGSEGRIRGSSIRDYVEDVSTVAEGLDTAPIVVGHSMGGFVTQHYLASGHRAAGAILVSTVPMTGAWGATFKVAARHPWRFLKTNLTLDAGAVVETPQAARDLLVGERVPDELFQRCFERLERASYRVYLDLLFNRPDLREVDVPTLVIGGSEDAFFSIREWQRTARALGVPVETLQGASHQPMWEDEGAELVSVIARFVDEVGR